KVQECEETAGRVGEPHQRSAVQHPARRAFVGAPGEAAPHLVLRRGDDLEPEEPRERCGCMGLRRELGIGVHEEGGYPHGVSTDTASRPALERNWWLRAVTALVAPRPIFASLRDESTEAVEARQEILAAIAVLAAISVALASHTFRQILNAGGVSPLVIAV